MSYQENVLDILVLYGHTEEIILIHCPYLGN